MLDLTGHLYDDLSRLVTLIPLKRAAVRDVWVLFYSDGPQGTNASAMILAFISGSLPRLQRLQLNWAQPFDPYGEDWSKVSCRADA